MAERIRIVVVDDAYETPASNGRPRRTSLPLEPAVSADGSQSTLPVESEPYSLTLLVEWYRALAGAEWQWT
jgi:hypothetical protein